MPSKKPSHPKEEKRGALNEEAQKQRALRLLNTIAGIFQLLDMSDLFAIFAMHLKNNWRTVLNETAKYPMFLAAAVFAVIGAGFSIERSRLNGSNDNIEWAVIRTISAILISGAVGLALFGPTELAEYAPYIFAGVLGFQGLVSGTKSAVHGIQARRTADPEENNSHHEQARGHAMGMVIGFTITAAIIAVMIMKHADLAYIGVAGAGVGLIETTRQLVKNSSKGKTGGYVQVATDDLDQNQNNVFELGTGIKHSIEISSSTNLVLKREMEQSPQAEQKAKSTNPYHSLPTIGTSTVKMAQGEIKTDNVIPLPSVSDVTLGVIKSANDMERLGKTGTETVRPSVRTENPYSHKFGLKS